MLKEFAHCYNLKTGTLFDVKCRQIRYVQLLQCSWAIHTKSVCTDALRILSTWPLKRSYQCTASSNIILGILKKTQSQRMQMWVIGMRLASSEPSALRCASLLDFDLLSLCCVDQAHSSSQCKQLFKTIQERIKIRPCQLLLDVKVHWSSTYIMLTCAESRHQVSGWCQYDTWY